MIKGALFRVPPASKLGFAVGIVFISFFIFYLLGLGLGVAIFGPEMLTDMRLLTDLENDKTISILKFFQFIQSVGLFIIPPFIVGWVVYGNISSFLRFNRKPFFSSLIITVLLVFCFLPFSNFLAYLNSFLVLPDFLSGLEQWMKSAEASAFAATKAFLDVDTGLGLFYNIVLIAVLPAIGEELLFRGVLQRFFTEWFKSKAWGILVAAFLFSAVHFQFYGFLPRFALGILFGYLLELTSTMWIPILAHFINNATGVILGYFIAKGSVPVETENWGMTPETFVYSVTGGVMAGLLLVLLIRKEKRVL